MSRVTRSCSILGFGVTFAIVLLARTTAPVQALRQGSGQAPRQGSGQPTTATAGQIAPFVGDWLVTVQAMANDAIFAVSVKNDGGTPSATIRSNGQPTVNVTDITVAGNSLVLKYMSQPMGTPISTVMTLTPDGAAFEPSMAVMDGQYEMAGTAAKQAAGRARSAPPASAAAAAPPTSEATDFTPKPPYRPRTPAEEAARLHAAHRLPHGARRRRPRRHQPDAHRVRRQRPDVRRRDDQLHDGRRAPAASTIRSAASAGGRAPRATATTTSTPCSPTSSSRRA